MDADFFQNNPFRSPEWRSDRALQLVTHSKGPLPPRRFDDRFVRIYRSFLLKYLAAGTDENKLQAVIVEWPQVYWAHVLQFGPDSERRDSLQARVLTGEPISKLAKRFSIDEMSVELFEKLHFDVRDRLSARVWIAKVVLQTSALMAPSHSGITPEQRRGLVYKFFAFHGGSLVLDTVITGLAHTPMPQRAEDVEEWFQDAPAQSIRSRAAAGALFMEINKKNVIGLLKQSIRAKEADKSSKAGNRALQADREKQAAEILAAIERSASLWKRPDCNGDGPSQPLDPVDTLTSKERS